MNIIFLKRLKVCQEMAVILHWIHALHLKRFHALAYINYYVFLRKKLKSIYAVK